MCLLLSRLFFVSVMSRVSSLARSSTVEAGLAQRARIVLLAAQGVPNAEIGRPGGGFASDGDSVAQPV